MSEFVSVERINALKTGIESKTGETYTDLTAGVQALVDGYGQGGGTGSSPGNLFQTVDIVVDNTSATFLIVDLEDDTLDNYAMEAVVIETGVYTDGVLSLDETPTVPLGMNIPVQCCGVILKTQLSMDILAGTSTISGFQSGGCYIVRGTLNSYGGQYIILSEAGEIGIKANYNWGKAGYYFKFRVNVYGWNNP